MEILHSNQSCLGLKCYKISLKICKNEKKVRAFRMEWVNTNLINKYVWSSILYDKCKIHREKALNERRWWCGYMHSGVDI